MVSFEGAADMRNDCSQMLKGSSRIPAKVIENKFLMEKRRFLVGPRLASCTLYWTALPEARARRGHFVFHPASGPEKVAWPLREVVENTVEKTSFYRPKV
jgi:hypothetical protein